MNDPQQHAGPALTEEGGATRQPQDGNLRTAPIVDITATVAGIRDHAARHRRAAEKVMDAAWHQHRTLHQAANYLDDLANTLEGKS